MNSDYGQMIPIWFDFQSIKSYWQDHRSGGNSLCGGGS